MGFIFGWKLTVKMEIIMACFFFFTLNFTRMRKRLMVLEELVKLRNKQNAKTSPGLFVCQSSSASNTVRKCHGWVAVWRQRPDQDIMWLHAVWSSAVGQLVRLEARSQDVQTHTHTHRHDPRPCTVWTLAFSTRTNTPQTVWSAFGHVCSVNYAVAGLKYWFKLGVCVLC